MGEGITYLNSGCNTRKCGISQRVGIFSVDTVNTHRTPLDELICVCLKISLNSKNDVPHSHTA